MFETAGFKKTSISNEIQHPLGLVGCGCLQNAHSSGSHIITNAVFYYKEIEHLRAQFSLWSKIVLQLSGKVGFLVIDDGSKFSAVSVLEAFLRDTRIGKYFL